MSNVSDVSIVNRVKTLVKSPWFISTGIHVGLLSLAMVLSLVSPSKPKQSLPQTVAFELKQAPQKEAPRVIKKEERTPDIKQNQKQEQVNQSQAKRVFGINKKTLLDDDNATASDGVSVKAGNTLTKAPDNEVYTGDDTLPAPKAEYLLTQQAIPKEKFSAEFTSEAKKAGIDYAEVHLLALIDQMGEVRQVSVKEDPGYGLAEEAMRAFKKFKFVPAQIGDDAVPVEINYVFIFEKI